MTVVKHFCAGCYIYNENYDKILLIFHKKNKKWMQPGGHLEENEDPEEAVLREVKEETGLEVELLGERIPRTGDYICPIAVQKDEVDGHIHMVFIYAAQQKNRNQKIQINEREVEDVGWFDLDGVWNLDTYDDVIKWTEYLLNPSFIKKITSDSDGNF